MSLSIYLCEEFYQFSYNYPEYQLTSYESILERNGLKWDDAIMRSANEMSLDAQCILALIMGAIRANRFCEGTLLSLFEDGYIIKWLKRLKCIDDHPEVVDIEEIYFEIGGYGGYDTYHVIFKEEEKVTIITTIWCEPPVEKTYL